MLGHLLMVVGQVATLFLMIGVGFILGKRKVITAVGTQQMSALLINVVTPCMIINAFPSDWDMESLRLLGTGLLASMGIYAAYALVAAPLFRRESLDQRAPLRFGSIYGNVGFMGLPLIDAVLGQDALVYATIVIVMFNIFAYTHGVIIMGGETNLPIKNALLNPGIIGTAIALPLFLGRITLPGPIHNAIGYLSNLNTPMAMVVIGAQISQVGFTRAFREKRFYWASLFKLLILPIVTILLLTPFRLDHTLYVTLVVLAATPTAGTTSMLSERYSRDTPMAAQLVALSTLLSVLTLPVIAVLAEQLAG